MADRIAIGVAQPTAPRTTGHYYFVVVAQGGSAPQLYVVAVGQALAVHRA
jgi:hypothetical protein